MFKIASSYTIEQSGEAAELSPHLSPPLSEACPLSTVLLRFDFCPHHSGDILLSKATKHPSPSLHPLL